MNINTKIITRTGILLALTIVFQAMGRYIPLGPNSNFIVGPLVNAGLLITTAAAGLTGGTVVALLTPFGAILTGAAIPLPLAPVIAAGNFILVLLFHIFIEKNKIAGILTGALLKFVFLLASIHVFANLADLPGKKADMLIYIFSWPQFVTAITGGVIAMIIIKSLGKKIEL